MYQARCQRILFLMAASGNLMLCSCLLCSDPGLLSACPAAGHLPASLTLLCCLLSCDLDLPVWPAGQYNCFLNVIIQALWHLPSFRQALLAMAPAKLKVGCMKAQSKGRLTCAARLDLNAAMSAA